MTVLRRERLASYLIMISARTSCWWKIHCCTARLRRGLLQDTPTFYPNVTDSDAVSVSLSA